MCTMLVILGLVFLLAALLAVRLQSRRGRTAEHLGTMSERWVAEHRRWHSDL